MKTERLTLFTTVLAKLVLVVSERTVQGRQFSQLVSLVIVLSFRCRCGLADNLSVNVYFIASSGTHRLDNPIN
jgi:hypothetical protein